MSTFAVEVREISEVKKHPNADRLDICKVKGMDFQFVTGRGQYLVGDSVVYFPLDSILPSNIITTLGLDGRLGGKDKNRVSTVRLRGEISQGIVVAYAEIGQHTNGDDWPDGDMSKALGVTKYDPPPVPCHAGNLVKLPAGSEVYDIEGADRYPAVLNELRAVGPVWISEKLEGQNYSLKIEEGQEPIVCQRKYAISPVDGKEHTLWAATRRQKLVALGEKIRAIFDVSWIILRGEACGPGIQKNIYNLKEVSVYLFDIKLPSGYLPACIFLETMRAFAPPIHGDWRWVGSEFTGNLDLFLGSTTIQQRSNGESCAHSTGAAIPREGIVIKPLLVEKQSEVLNGRLVIKQRSPEYLERQR